MYTTLYTFSNIDDMRMTRGGPNIAATIMGENYPLSTNYTVYIWDITSTASESLPNIVQATDPDTMAPWVGTGRWVKVESISAPQVNSDWAASTGISMILNKPTLFSGSYTDLTNKPTYAAVATSGSYNDLNSKPSIPAAQVNSDWNSVSGLSQILNKPTIPSAQVNSDWSAASGIAQILNKPTLATVATSGSYNDLANKPTIPTVSTQSQSAVTRSLNTAFQISTTRNAFVSYSVQLSVTASISGGQNGDVILEIASDSGFTTNVQTVSISGLGQTYTLAVALQGVQPQTGVVSGFIPAGYYTRLRTVNNTGTPTFSYRAGQEALI